MESWEIVAFQGGAFFSCSSHVNHQHYLLVTLPPTPPTHPPLRDTNTHTLLRVCSSLYCISVSGHGHQCVKHLRMQAVWRLEDTQTQISHTSHKVLLNLQHLCCGSLRSTSPLVTQREYQVCLGKKNESISFQTHNSSQYFFLFIVTF